MAVTMADITKLRKMTGAGMMDCKNALTEAEGDFDKAMKIIREKGQAVAAKRSKSGTEPLIRVMVEGEDEAQVTEFAHRIADAVKAV